MMKNNREVFNGGVSRSRKVKMAMDHYASLKNLFKGGEFAGIVGHWWRKILSMLE